MNLDGHVALVTGAAHRVGKGIALALAREGTHIALHFGTSLHLADQSAEEISQMGVDVLPIQADLADPSNVAVLVDTVADHFGRLDVLVNSAATFEAQDFDDITPAQWDRVLAVNLRAPFLLSQSAARVMRQSGRGTPALIVNIADLSGVHPWIGYAAHSVSKAGLIHLTKIAARELAPEVRVNALVAGAILPPPGLDEGSDRWQELIAGIPMKRSGSLQDIGTAMIFLARNDFVTGMILPVDGGEGLLGSVNH